MSRVVRAFVLILAAGIAVPVAGAAPVRPAARQHAGVDWTRTVTVSPGGSFVMGNPRAKVTITEFASYTCPHCAHFSAEVVPQIEAKYVRPGLVRYEFKNAVHDGFDLSAAVIARCAGPKGFFPLTARFFAEQPRWAEQAGKWVEQQGDAIAGRPAAEKPFLFAQGAGLTALAAGAGVPIARQKACLADKAATDAVIALARDAEDRQIPGTPAIFVNNVLAAGVHDWAGLEPVIKQALQ